MLRQVMDATSVSVLQELLVEQPILAEVLAEIQENTLAVLLQIYLIPADAVCAVIDGE